MRINMVMLLRMPKLLWLRCVHATAPRSPIRPHLLPARSLTMAQEHTGTTSRTSSGCNQEGFAKASTEASGPRADDGMTGPLCRLPQQWPCFGAQNPMKPQGSAHGAWVHCAVCNPRLQYVPKKGSHSGSTKVENPAMIQRMLQRLQPMMSGHKPNQQICLAMVKLIEAKCWPSTSTRWWMLRPSTVPSRRQSQAPKSRLLRRCDVSKLSGHTVERSGRCQQGEHGLP